MVYVYLSPWEIPQDIRDKMSEGLETGHACVIETSQVLALFKDLVKMRNVTHAAHTGSTGLPKGILSPYWWQAYCSELYLGDPRRATEEKGRILNEIVVANIVNAIKAVKEDRITPGIADDFLKRAFGA